MLRVDDTGRVRLLTLDRPDALNVFNESLYDALTDALIGAQEDDGVAVVVITGAGRAFCAGTDLLEMAARMTDPDFEPGRHGFVGLIDHLVAFDKPLLCAVNGLGLGIGATILGLVDLAFISTEARLKCPFTSLGVAPEAASSFTFPQRMGRQAASWALMSSEWLSPEDCVRWGLALQACPPDQLLPTTMEHAQVLASRPISSLRSVKRLIGVHDRAAIDAAREGENAAFIHLMGGPANSEALAAFAEKREPDFANLPPGW